MNDTVSEDVKLEPCPFCSGNAMWNPKEIKTGKYDDDYGYVDCAVCGVRTEGRTTRAIATLAWNRRTATKPASPLPGDVTPVYRVDWENAPRDGSWVLLLSKGTHPDYRVEQRLYWSKHYSIHGLGGCWSDGFVTMSDLDFIGWRFDASPPMPGRGEGFVLVPVEPSEELWIAFSMEYAVEGYENFVKAYRALITSASRPKEDTHAE